MYISIKNKLRTIWGWDTVKIKKTKPQLDSPGSHTNEY